MKLNLLISSTEVKKEKKRVGRGRGSGKGKTAGKGTKGYLTRKGSKKRPWEEGGQMPLQRRVPKRGFSNKRFKKIYEVVNLERISELGLSDVNLDIMRERGLVRKKSLPVKVLGNGQLKQAVKITAHAFSKSAKEKIEKVGGQVRLITNKRT